MNELQKELDGYRRVLKMFLRERKNLQHRIDVLMENINDCKREACKKGVELK